MKIFRNLPPASERGPCVLTIGNFDGVHRGHQAVLANLKRVAGICRLPMKVLTFEPQPREFFAHSGRGVAPARIQSLRDKACALKNHGISQLGVIDFGLRWAQMPAEEFITDYLVRDLQIKHLFIGDDFQFGAHRRGNFEMLSEHGNRLGFGVERMPTLEDNGERISSSAVRSALTTGNFARAEQLLGRPYLISGRVIHGRKLGRTLGFPTLNMRVPGASEQSSSLPLLSGVFAVRVHGLNEAVLGGVASLGTRPAVEQNGHYLLETHVFDYSGNAYGKALSIEFVEKLRNEANYPSLEALTAQILLDAKNARQILLKVPTRAAA